MSKSLRIESADRRSHFELTQHVDDGHRAYAWVCSVNASNASLAARNDDVHLSGFHRFIADFDRFLLDRSVVPVLDATEDCRLQFSCPRTVMTIEFAVAIGVHSLHGGRYRVEGSFPVQQEALLPLLTRFRDMAAGER